LTEDRQNDGTRRQPGSPDPVPSDPTGAFADQSDGPEQPEQLEELEELALDDSDDSLASPIPEPGSSAEPASSPGERGEMAGIGPSDDIDGLRKKVEEKDAQLAQVMTAYRGLKKETERLRKRIEHHQKCRFEQSKNDFIGRFVEVLDNLDRAIESIENNFDPDSVLEGIILVRSRLVQLLREEGLEKIFVGGQSFDPTHSEAAGIEPVGDASQDNVVLKELQRGYMLKGALLRPARVVVGRYSHAAGDDPSEENHSPTPPASETPTDGEYDDPDRT